MKKEASENKGVTWFTWLANNLYEVLFFIGGVIVVLGFLRMLSKKRAYMNGDEDDFPHA